MIFVGGHSLGAARALLYAWSRRKRGLPVDGVYALAPPRPGDHSLGSVIETIPFKMALRNRVDPVTEVPVDLPGIDYAQPLHLTAINESPDVDDIGPQADHHIGLYQAGAHKLSVIDAPLDIGPAADLIARLYETADGWDWLHSTDGEYCAITHVGDVKLVVFRGSITAHDWLDDFDATQITVMGSRVSKGFWAGVGPVENEIDAQLASGEAAS